MWRESSRSKLRAALRRAFAIPGRQPLTDRQRQWIEALGRKVVERRLAAPALLLLESVGPFGYLGAQAVAFFKPIASLVVPPQLCEQLVELLQKRAAVDALIETIERCDGETRSPRPKQDRRP